MLPCLMKRYQFGIAAPCLVSGKKYPPTAQEAVEGMVWESIEYSSSRKFSRNGGALLGKPAAAPRTQSVIIIENHYISLSVTDAEHTMPQEEDISPGTRSLLQ